MSTALAALFGGAAVYGAAGFAVVSLPDRAARLDKRVLLSRGFMGLLGLGVAAWGAYLLYRHFVSPGEIENLRLAVIATTSVVPVGLVSALIFLLAGASPGGGKGGRGGDDDDLPPPPDPDGPDGWAEFERAFREYAAVRETLRV